MRPYSSLLNPSLDRIAITLIGFAYAGIQFLQVAWISKSYGPMALGSYALVVGVFAPILSFFSVSQRFEILAKDQSRIKTHIYIRISVIVLTTIIFGIYVVAGGARAREMVVLVATIGTIKLLESGFEIKAWVHQRRLAWRQFYISASGRIFPILVCCVFGLFFEIDLEEYLFSVAAISLLYFFIICKNDITRLGRGANFFHDFRGTIVIVAGLLPLGIAAALESWAVVWPRYSLEQALGLEQVGRFLIFSQIAIIFGIAASGRLQADMPKLARLSAENNRSAVLSTSLNAILSIAIINCILFIVMKSIPGSWIAFLFGEWVAKDSSLPAIVSVISWIWYSGGYVANCVAICKGRRWMALMACGLILVVLLVDLAGSRFVDNPYGVAVGALAIAFLARFIASLAVLLTWRYKC